MKSAVVAGLMAAALPLASAAAVETPKRDTKVSYDGFEVVRLAAKDASGSIQERLSGLSSMHILNTDVDDHLDVAIGPKDLDAFKELGLEGKVLHKDLGKDLLKETFGKYERTSSKSFSSASGSSKGKASAADLPSLDWFDDYHSYEDHMAYIEDLHSAFSNQSEIIETGESYEGNPITGIHFWGSGGKGNNPAVLWHGTVHAREWITAKTVEYLTYQLMDGYLEGDSEIVDIVDKYDFYVFPFVNPDGFIYSVEEDRMWRKNRQPRDGASCAGTDINRNWAYEWDVEGGASDDPCNETFRGEEAGDTPEIEGIQGFVDELASGQGIKQYIDWHSFGQYILLPYGYDCGETAENHDYQIELAEEVADLIEGVHGTEYTYGASCDHLYQSTGSSVDYVSAEGEAEVSWTIELRPSSQFDGGFVLPADQILPTGEETWEAFKWLLAEM